MSDESAGPVNGASSAARAVGPALAEQLARVAVDQVAIRKEIRVVDGRVTDLAESVRLLPEVAEAVRDLSDRLDQLAGAGPEDGEATPTLWNWRYMDTEQATEAWETLAVWVDEVLAGVYHLLAGPAGENRFAIDPNTGTLLDEGRRVHVVPACWYRHPDVVVELGWLAQMWTWMYADTGSGAYRSSADWHSRYLPDVVHRISRDSTAAGCASKGSHQGDLTPEQLDTDGLAAFITEDLSHRPAGETDETAPAGDVDDAETDEDQTDETDNGREPGPAGPPRLYGQ